MQYYSTNNNSPAANFEQATINGLAPDKGLYFPESIPVISTEMIAAMEHMSDSEIAFNVIKPYVGDCIPEDELLQIVTESINFSIPLVPISDTIFSLELFHGPTLAFKDIGARFMSRCLGYFLKDEQKKVTVLVATSGDTGGAVAHGFYDVPNIKVVILYPSKRVSLVQEKQLTTLGKNITAIEVTGSFDDCQHMVKQAFADEALNAETFLTSANSINIARWLPQQFYYFFAYKQWPDKSNPPVIAVPSGNFGNICAGLLAKASGLPLGHFIAACNANDVVPKFLQSGRYKPQSAKATMSNAMDVGDPSNFVRIMEIFRSDIDDVRSELSAISISDRDTRETIKKVYETQHYLLDPHGAVGYKALENYLIHHAGQKGIVIETAHPVKFHDVVEPVIGNRIPMPPAIIAQQQLTKTSVLMEPTYERLKQFLLDNARSL